MTFLHGFFLVNFPPFGLIVLAGILLFFLRNDKSAKWYYPLLFIVIILVVISFWRIPVLIDRRYAMPTMINGIVISTFVLMLLPEIFKKLKIPYANAITRVIVTVLLIACTAKAMRVQEIKDYLHDISEVIRLDCQKNNIKGNVPLLVFGNSGGYLELDNNIVLFNIANRYLNAKLADTDYQFHRLTGCLDPNILKIRHPHLYLLCAELKSSNFSKDWAAQYHENPELLFEYLNPKNQITYRLYRVLSKNKTAWYSSPEFDEFLKINNIWVNYDFSQTVKVLSTDQAVMTLKKRGIDLPDDDFYLPAGWQINTGHGWAADCSPVSIKFTAGNTLNITSKNIVSLCSSNAISGRKQFVIVINTGSEHKGKLLLCVYKYNKNDKFIDAFILRDINLEKPCDRQLIMLESLNCDKVKLTLLSSGETSISNIMVIPLEAIAK